MVESWKNDFLDKLGQAKNQWVKQFEDAIKSAVEPAYDNLRSFLADNGFSVSKPMCEEGRHSFKFELAENAYLLMIFRQSGVGEFEVRCETFVPGGDPVLMKAVARLKEVDEEWASQHFQSALDTFVDLLCGRSPADAAEELATV